MFPTIEGTNKLSSKPSGFQFSNIDSAEGVKEGNSSILTQSTYSLEWQMLLSVHGYQLGANTWRTW